ncbi:hypothetical protein HU200_009722 [Digitaria exilis]|uniref:C2 domain-containing protein n=1 Tax=Digitaria exilis TaxID=1010633 RepID=A0A835FJB1_9POAL|nr:hypothetical protein HU200_009722 [Digitaria exilis]
MKENASWDQPIHLPIREQQGGGGDDHPSGGFSLEAAVYNYTRIEDKYTTVESLIGTAVVDQKYFDSHASKAGFFPHDLVKSSSSDHPDRTSLGPVVNGKLTLKVFYSDAYDKVLIGIEDDTRYRPTGRDGAVVYDFLFSSKDHRDEEDDKQPSISTEGFSWRPADDDVSPRKIKPSFERGKVVERMQFLFVQVVKARQLPDVDAYGRLDPFVEVKFGAYNNRFTKCLKGDDNPEWNNTFAFYLQDGKAPPSSGVHVLVKDGDEVRDELVGKLYFYLKDVPVRHPDDAQPEPTWHPLLDPAGGNGTVGEASLLLAIWIGSQADDAYRHAWESPYGPKVYENPRLWCLRVTIVEVQGIVAACDEDDEDEADGGARSASRSLRDELFCRVCLGAQVRKTRLASKTMQTTSSGSYEWKDMEDLVFIAAQPFFDSNLQVYVVAASSRSSLDTQEHQDQEEEEEVIGQLSIPLASIDKRDASAYDCDQQPPATHTAKWFDLKSPSPPRPQLPWDAASLDEAGVGGSVRRHMRIRLRSLLDGGYHIGHDPQGYMDDTRPAERQLWGPPIAQVHLGILRATGLQIIGTNDTSCCRDGIRKSAELNPYCVAKYGDKWVRTRTISNLSSDHVFNEEYTWDVYDIATVLNVGVFDHRPLNSAHREIGKVRIHLSCLETHRIYAHAYPLVTLTSSGVIKTGELHLAVKISSPSTKNMLRMYSRPTLPKMHYAQPLEDSSWTRDTTVNILALRLNRMEPPLRREVVAYLCNAESCNSNSWCLRRSKVNFYRFIATFSTLFRILRLFEGVIKWRNPLVTLLIHAIFVLGLWFHELVLPLVFMCVGLLGLWNYRFCPSRPVYFDLGLSGLDFVHPDELDEEFDTADRPSRKIDSLVRMRYDRLRSVAGRIQTVIGDVAVKLERIQSLLSWRDVRATAIFMHFLLVAAAVVYFVPCKILVALAGFYIMRHPRLRRRTNIMTSIPVNFLRRLPSKQDQIMVM